MSYLGTALKVVLDRRELPARRISELADIDPSLFSRYLTGSVRPSREFLEKLCRSLSEPEDRAEIVIAHLRDETPESAQDLIRILSLVAATSLKEDPAPAKAKLPKKTLEDFDYLMRRAESHPEVSEWIASTVDVLRGR